MIIDNSPTSYLFHPECAIPTNSWYDDQNDMELYQLLAILEKLAKVDDVRPYIKQFVSDNKVNFAKAAKILKGGKLTERSNSEPPLRNEQKKISPPVPKEPTEVQNKEETKNEPEAKPKPQPKPKPILVVHEESKTSDGRNNFTPNVMMNTWTPTNKNLEEQIK